jgi:hypothetical protein
MRRVGFGRRVCFAKGAAFKSATPSCACLICLHACNLPSHATHVISSPKATRERAQADAHAQAEHVGGGGTTYNKHRCGYILSAYRCTCCPINPGCKQLCQLLLALTLMMRAASRSFLARSSLARLSWSTWMRCFSARACFCNAAICVSVADFFLIRSGDMSFA